LPTDAKFPEERGHRFSVWAKCQERLGEIQRLHPRAYEKWADEDVAHLIQLFRSGKTAQQIAETLQRQPSTIRSRLKKLYLISSS
jgi:hypothetical protein